MKIDRVQLAQIVGPVRLAVAGDSADHRASDRSSSSHVSEIEDGSRTGLKDKSPSCLVERPDSRLRQVEVTNFGLGAVLEDGG